MNWLAYPQIRWYNCIFVFLHKNVCCDYSLEAPHRGASNEYPQHRFFVEKDKNIIVFVYKILACLELVLRSNDWHIICIILILPAR